MALDPARSIRGENHATTSRCRTTGALRRHEVMGFGLHAEGRLAKMMA